MTWERYPSRRTLLKGTHLTAQLLVEGKEWGPDERLGGEATPQRAHYSGTA